MVEIDLNSGQILECYSFSRSAWMHLSQKESLIATLTHLPLKQVALEKRRRIGPPPMSGEPDYRKIWNPPLIVEGEKQENAQFDVFETTWPADGTDLSGKEVSLYFDKEKKFPLPFWIQVETSHLIGSLRTIDSGTNLPSIHRSMPRRAPQFIGLPQKTETGIKLSLKSPKYYRNFELFAIDITSKERNISPISYSAIDTHEELMNLEINKEELSQALEEGHEYTFLLVPAGHNGSYTETLKPFRWTP